MRNRTKRVCATALCILCLLALFPVRAAAAGAIDTRRDVRLTIEYRHDGKPVASVPFDLYYVASVDAYANFTLAGDFAAYCSGARSLANRARSVSNITPA